MTILTKKEQLRDLILNGISQEELDNNYDYSKITDMSNMFFNCTSLKEIPLLNTSKVINKAIENYANLSPTVEYRVDNLNNTRLVEIGRLAVSDLSYMIDSNTTFSFSQSIFEDEESELFQFWIEDITL